MAVTKKKLVDDIILRVTKGAPSDDLEIEPRQIEFWFDLVAKTAVPDYLNAKIEAKEALDPQYILIEDNKTAIKEDITMLEDCDDRVYITTTKTPLNLTNDLGIMRVITEEGTFVNNVPIEVLDTINKLTFGKPNRENLLYTRIDNKIYIHGLKSHHLAILKFSVYYIPTVEISALADNDTVKVSDNLLATISEAVERMALKEIYSIDPDQENDAQDDNSRPGGDFNYRANVNGQ
jgi:hypothetical protein